MSNQDRWKLEATRHEDKALDGLAVGFEAPGDDLLSSDRTERRIHVV